MLWFRGTRVLFLNMAPPSVTLWMQRGWTTPGKVCQGWRMEGLDRPHRLQKKKKVYICIVLVNLGYYNRYYSVGGLNNNFFFNTSGCCKCKIRKVAWLGSAISPFPGLLDRLLFIVSSQERSPFLLVLKGN